MIYYTLHANPKTGFVGFVRQYDTQVYSDCFHLPVVGNGSSKSNCNVNENEKT